MVFHAGTASSRRRAVTSGGRVLCVTALADSVKQAQQRAYDVARGIHFDGAQYRRDIGHRAIKTPMSPPHDHDSTVGVRGYAAACGRASSPRIGGLDGRPFRAGRSLAQARPATSAGAAGRDGITLHHGGRRGVERAGRWFLARRGLSLPPSATQHRPELAGRRSRPWACRWCSIRATLRADRAHERA